MQERTEEAEKEAERARQEVDQLKKDHEREIESLKKILAETSRLGEKEASRSGEDHTPKWKEEFEQPYSPGEFSKGAEEASWFSRYDQCNM